MAVDPCSLVGFLAIAYDEWNLLDFSFHLAFPRYCDFFILFFFFLMNRRPPISPLFPYPPLFRSCRHSSSRDVAPIARAVRTHGCRIAASTDPAVRRATRGARNQASVNAGRTRLAGRSAPMLGRSEEHTSELQSRLHLVCRLLLEK